MDDERPHNLKEKFKSMDAVDRILVAGIVVLLVLTIVSYAQESVAGGPVMPGLNSRGGSGIGGLGIIGRGLGGGSRGRPGS
ncbi:MAG: hypothetical protein ABIH11_08445 [Candidatus Altiarchaeota archaeon]